jgi:putative glycosyltransferase (TIGR04372 family)
MVFRPLRRFLKPRLKRYPAAFRVYDAMSWAFTRSHAAVEVKRFFPRVGNTIFPMWLGPRYKLARRYAVEGKLDKARAIADDILTRKPDFNDFRIYWIGGIYWLQGRYEDAYRLFERVEVERYELARELQYDRLQLRFFLGMHFTPIGHLGMLDKYVKAEMLGMIPRQTNVLTGAEQDFANPAYLRYWEKYLSRITNPRTIALLAPLSSALQQHLNLVRVGGTVHNFVAFARDAQLRWEAEGRRPLLELSAEHRERGYRRLHEVGVPNGAWFVGLHVREGSDRTRDVRNADIASYRLAVDEIAKRGGWVLRMGDPSMRPLPPWPNTVDYAHSARREDWMDVFLWAEGRFFIGTASGPQIIPTTFGKPVAIANYGPIANVFVGKDDILLPKHYWNKKEERYLTLAERMSPEYGFGESISAFASTGIRVVDNSPEELRELVIEMMDRLDGRHAETEHERLLQARFAEVAAAHEVYPARIARAFLSRHPDLFGP